MSQPIPSPESPSSARSTPSAVVIRYTEFEPGIWELLHPLRFYIVGVAVFTALILVIGARPVREKWRKARPTSEAEEFIACGDFTPARASVFQRACKESPDHPDLLRGLALSCAADDPALARRCYNRLCELHASTPEDDARHAVLLVGIRDFTDARAVLDHARNGGSGSIALLHAELTLARESGDLDAAVRTLDALAPLTAPTADDCLETAEAAVRAGAPATIVARLEKHTLDALDISVAEGRIEELGARAERLTALPLHDPAERTRALLLLHKLEDAPIEQRLAAVLFAHECAGRSHDETRLACYEEIRRAGGLSAAGKNRVCAMLQRRGEHNLVVEIITQPESLLEEPLFERRLASLLHLGQWREATAMVTESHAPRPTHGRVLCRTLASLRSVPAVSTIVLGLLSDSLKEAVEENHPAGCFTIGCIALEHSLLEMAEEAFACAAGLSTEHDTIAGNILDVARSSGLNVGELLRVFKRSKSTHACNPAVQSRLCYLRLLLQEDLDAARAFITTQTERAPGDAYLHFLTALDLHQRGDHAGALKLLVPLPQHRWHQGEAAVIASMIADAGQFERCTPLIERIDFSRLFPEERAMIERWRTRFSFGPALSTSLDGPRLEDFNK